VFTPDNARECIAHLPGGPQAWTTEALPKDVVHVSPDDSEAKKWLDDLRQLPGYTQTQQREH
jgi:hypothetical protein